MKENIENISKKSNANLVGATIGRPKTKKQAINPLQIVGVDAPLRPKLRRTNQNYSKGILKSKFQTLTSNAKGITLIALIITIIVMLILVGVTVNIAINGGLFSTAKNATTQTQKSIEEEELQSAVLGLMDVKTGKVDLEKLQGELSNWKIDTNTGKCISPDGNEFTVEDYGNTQSVEYAKVTEIFDANGKDEKAGGYNPDALHIGDFINYDAGTWTQNEIKEIKTGETKNLVQANGKKTKANQNYQFGGFAAGDSRNGHAIIYSKDNTYLKDISGREITGWRVFDVNDDGVITLVSAGCPEGYWSPKSDLVQYAGCISEYILTGKINSTAVNLNLDLQNNYTIRNWSKYLNTNKYATDARILTKTDLDNWFEKYMNEKNISEKNIFEQIYGNRYETLIDNYSYYWLGQDCDTNNLWTISPIGQSVGYHNSDAYGVRIVVTLSSDVKLGKISKKTVADPRNVENSWTYNIWDIK